VPVPQRDALPAVAVRGLPRRRGPAADAARAGAAGPAPLRRPYPGAALPPYSERRRGCLWLALHLHCTAPRNADDACHGCKRPASCQKLECLDAHRSTACTRPALSGGLRGARASGAGGAQRRGVARAVLARGRPAGVRVQGLQRGRVAPAARRRGHAGALAARARAPAHVPGLEPGRQLAADLRPRQCGAPPGPLAASLGRAGPIRRNRSGGEGGHPAVLVVRTVAAVAGNGFCASCSEPRALATSCR